MNKNYTFECFFDEALDPHGIYAKEYKRMVGFKDLVEYAVNALTTGDKKHEYKVVVTNIFDGDLDLIQKTGTLYAYVLLDGRMIYQIKASIADICGMIMWDYYRSEHEEETICYETANSLIWLLASDIKTELEGAKKVHPRWCKVTNKRYLDLIKKPISESETKFPKTFVDYLETLDV